MRAIGIVFLYDRTLGEPEVISKQFSKHFSDVGENLVLEGLMDLTALKEILDMKRVYWGGIKENFLGLLNDDDSIGKIAWKVFFDNSKIKFGIDTTLEPSKPEANETAALFMSAFF